ncbi:cytochrome c [Edaphobacter sp. HDX4]|uniref:c-type cytochrome n=1 Tax=Edaphobacter sp. HDX4 TaxID=2794064 RepID=UPI002FE68935
MRILAALLSGLVITSFTGCRNASNSTSVAAAAKATVASVTGPIPGEVHEIHYRTNPYSEDAVAQQDGRRLFDWYNCSGCHGGHAGGGMGPSLRDRVWLYGNRNDQIFDSIAHGRSNGMPAWGTKIPESQIWQLVAYIQTMGTPQEPDPPTEPADEMVPDPHGSEITVAPQTSASEVK